MVEGVIFGRFYFVGLGVGGCARFRGLVTDLFEGLVILISSV